MRFAIPLAATLAASWAFTPLAHGQDPVRLKESFPAGYQYHVSSRVELSGTLTAPGATGVTPVPPQGSKPLAISGESAVEYDERVLNSNDGSVQKTVRLYRRLDFRRKIGDRPEENSLRPAVRLLVLLRHKQSEVPFSPDGPMTWAEIDLVRTDVFTPALTDLLPEREVRTGDRWPARKQAVQELTDLDEISDGQVQCKLQEIASRNGRRLARVDFTGTVTGTNEDGPNRQTIDGYFLFDLQSHHLSYLYLSGVSSMLDNAGKTLGKVEGRFVLTRRLEADVKELSDTAIRKVNVEPTEENTLLLFHEPSLGVQFLYPRRWTVRRADARQIALDEPKGGGLLITLEPLAQTPTGPQFQKEVQDSLRKQSAKVRRLGTPSKVTAATGELEHFDLEAEVGQEKLVLDYFVARQKDGGATFAGRFPFGEAAALHRDAERIARTLQLVPPKK